MTAYMGSARRHHCSSVIAVLAGQVWIAIQTVDVTITAHVQQGLAYVMTVNTGQQEHIVNTASLALMVTPQQK